MKNLFIFFILLLVITSCETNNKENPKKISTDSIAIEEVVKKTDSVKKIKNRLTLRREYLYGVWAENKEDNALFEITKKSITYVEFMENHYKYDLFSDSLLIHLEDNYTSISKIIKLTKDSLIFDTEDEITKLYKRH